jgi:acetyltransferase-like isoleucine patch superfamily enzyme
MISNFFKSIIWFMEYLVWFCRCDYALRLHGYAGLSLVFKRLPERYIIKFLKKYGANIGNNVVIKSGIYIHRMKWINKPFENLKIHDNVYIGTDFILDLTKNITISEACNIGSRVQFWTHSSYYKGDTLETRELCEYQGEIFLEEGATIYSNTVVKHGVRIGRFASVTANSMVNTNIEAFATASGVPVRVLRKK